MTEPVPTTSSPTAAHVAPLAVFMGFLLLPDVLRPAGFPATDESAAWWRRQPEAWLYPAQTIATLLVLVMYRRQYQFRPVRGLGLATVAGLVGIAIWVLPGFLFEKFGMSAGLLQYLGFVSRRGEFPPFLASPDQAVWYWLTVSLRFVRLVIAVPLAEEIFWRGFLMRFVVDPDGDYWKVPFGTFHRRSLVVVTALFVLVHAPEDYFAAAVFGLLMYAVAVRTRSLLACVVMHGVANLVLGIYVLATQQWGYW